MTLLVKNLVFTVLVPGIVAVLVPLLIAGSRTPAAGPSLALALLALGLGGAAYAWCLWDFAAFGRGTPAPIDPPRRLVIRGLYRYSRNPMYLGVLSVILGWAILFQAPGLVAYAAVLAVGFHLFIIVYEEPHLARAFGGDYEAYRARVGRWLPRRPRQPRA